MIFKQNKKGFSLPLLIGLGILISSIMLIVLSSNLNVDRPIGEKQYEILGRMEQVEASQVYIDEALKFSSQIAKNKFFQTAGIYAEEISKDDGFFSLCGSHIYPLYNKDSLNCLPDFRLTYKSFLKQNLDSYLISYPESSLSYSYTLSLSDVSDGKTKIHTNPLTPIIVPLYTKSTFKRSTDALSQPSTSYPKNNKVGGYGDEKQYVCSSGTCVVEMINYYHKAFASRGMKLSYVYGGRSPYTYADTLKEKKSSMFKKVNILAMQTGTTKPTTPGFDSAGWLWWIGYHGKIPQLYTGKNTLKEYYLSLKGSTTICGDKKTKTCTFEKLQKKAQPGDILFSGNNANPTQAMFYMGDNKVSYSKKGVGLVIKDISQNNFQGGEAGIFIIKRIAYLKNKNQKFDEENSLGLDASCILPIDFNQINLGAIRKKRISMEKLYAKLNEYHRMEAVASAVKEFDVPKDLIIAIMRNEIGNVDDYLSGKTGKSSSGMAGPMQISSDTCRVIQKNYGVCNYDKITDETLADVNQGIRAGAANIKEILTKSTYIKDDPNYYFVALEYNAGRGSLNNILHVASKRLGVEISQLQWADITYEDVRDGLKKLSYSWAQKEAKWREVYEYPNLMAQGLSTRCFGDPNAAYQSWKSTLEYTPISSTKVNMNFQETDKIKEFVKDVETCKDKLTSCIKEKVDIFNRENEPKIHLSTQEKTNSAAYEFADQLLNCKNNDQSNCLCSFNLQNEENKPSLTENNADVQQPTENELYLSLSEDAVILSLTKTGLIRTGSKENNVYISRNSIVSANIPLNLREGEKDTDEDLLLSLDLNKGEHQLENSQSIWIVGNDKTSKLVLRKGNVDSTQSFEGTYQKYVVDYAKKYLGTGYHTGSGLRDCTASEAQKGICKTQCGSFISDAFLYTVGNIESFGPNIVPRGNGANKCDSPVMRKFSDPKELELADVFSSTGGTKFGHTGMYVGKGFVKTPSRKRNDDYCYEEFIPNEKGEVVFIHSVGPVCYNTLSQLTGKQKRRIISFCRNKIFDSGKIPYTPLKNAPLVFLDEQTADITAVQVEGTNGNVFVERVTGANTPELPPNYPIKPPSDSQRVRDYEWATYDQDKDATSLCRENKRYFRFLAVFDFSPEKNFDFSLQLNDTLLDSNIKQESKLKKCAERNVAILKWSFPKETEKIYSFDLTLKNDLFTQEVIEIIESTAKELETDSQNIKEINQLFKKETDTSIKYYYMVSQFDGKILYPNTQYTFTILPIDHYLNKDEKANMKTSFKTPTSACASCENKIKFVTDFNPYSLGDCEDVTGVDTGSWTSYVKNTLDSSTFLKNMLKKVWGFEL